MRARDPAPSISLSTRLEINALIDALMGDGETFARESARRLIAILPVTPRESAFQAKVDWTSSGGVAQGAAAGGGTGTASTGEQERSVSIGSDGTFRIGGWRVAHRPGRIDIARMWSGPPDGESICRLTYDRATRAPGALLVSVDRKIVLGPVHLVFGRRFHLWKRAA